MIKTDKEFDRLTEILRKHPKGLTIAEVAILLNLNRTSTSKYLNILLASGMAEMRVYGPSKVYYPSHRIPISSILNFSTSLLLVMNDTLSIIDANKPLLDFFSIDKKDIIGHRIEYSPLGSYISGSFMHSILKALDSKEDRIEVNWKIREDEKYLSIKITPTAFEDGSSGVTLIADDVTELTRYRHNLEQLIDERSQELKLINEQLRNEIKNHKKARVKLQKSEQRYRALYSDNPSMYFTLDNVGTIVSVNTFGAIQLGYTIPELEGQSILTLIYHEDHQIALQQLRVSQQNPDELFHWELRKVTKTGTVLWVHEDARTVRELDGTLKTYLVSHDITEQKRIEEKLTAIINFLPDATFVVDTNGIVIAWNYAIEKMTGTGASEIIGKGNFEYSLLLYGTRRSVLIDLALAQSDLPDERYPNLKYEGEILTFEGPLYFKSGEEKLTWAKASPLYDDNHCLIGAIESLRDITEYRRIKTSLKESEAWFHCLFDNIFQFAAVLDLTGRITHVNQAALDFVGEDSETIIKRLFWDISCWSHDKKIRDKVRRSVDKVKGGECIRFETTNIDKSGVLHHIDYTIKPLTDDTGSVIAVLAEGRDISYLKIIEKELMKSRES